MPYMLWNYTKTLLIIGASNAAIHGGIHAWHRESFIEFPAATLTLLIITVIALGPFCVTADWLSIRFQARYAPPVGDLPPPLPQRPRTEIASDRPHTLRARIAAAKSARREGGSSRPGT